MQELPGWAAFTEPASSTTPSASSEPEDIDMLNIPGPALKRKHSPTPTDSSKLQKLHHGQLSAAIDSARSGYGIPARLQPVQSSSTPSTSTLASTSSIPKPTSIQNGNRSILPPPKPEERNRTAEASNGNDGSSSDRTSTTRDSGSIRSGEMGRRRRLGISKQAGNGSQKPAPPSQRALASFSAASGFRKMASKQNDDLDSSADDEDEPEDTQRRKRRRASVDGKKTAHDDPGPSQQPSASARVKGKGVPIPKDAEVFEIPDSDEEDDAPMPASNHPSPPPPFSRAQSSLASQSSSFRLASKPASTASAKDKPRHSLPMKPNFEAPQSIDTATHGTQASEKPRARNSSTSSAPTRPPPSKPKPTLAFNPHAPSPRQRKPSVSGTESAASGKSNLPAKPPPPHSQQSFPNGNGTSKSAEIPVPGSTKGPLPLKSNGSSSSSGPPKRPSQVGKPALPLPTSLNSLMETKALGPSSRSGSSNETTRMTSSPRKPKQPATQSATPARGQVASAGDTIEILSDDEEEDRERLQELLRKRKEAKGKAKESGVPAAAAALPPDDADIIVIESGDEEVAVKGPPAAPPPSPPPLLSALPVVAPAPASVPAAPVAAQLKKKKKKKIKEGVLPVGEGSSTAQAGLEAGAKGQEDPNSGLPATAGSSRRPSSSSQTANDAAQPPVPAPVLETAALASAPAKSLVPQKRRKKRRVVEGVLQAAVGSLSMAQADVEPGLSRNGKEAGGKKDVKMPGTSATVSLSPRPASQKVAEASSSKPLPVQGTNKDTEILHLPASSLSTIVSDIPISPPPKSIAQDDAMDVDRPPSPIRRSPPRHFIAPVLEANSLLHPPQPKPAQFITPILQPNSLLHPSQPKPATAHQLSPPQIDMEVDDPLPPPAKKAAPTALPQPESNSSSLSRRSKGSLPPMQKAAEKTKTLAPVAGSGDVGVGVPKATVGANVSMELPPSKAAEKVVARETLDKPGVNESTTPIPRLSRVLSPTISLLSHVAPVQRRLDTLPSSFSSAVAGPSRSPILQSPSISQAKPVRRPPSVSTDGGPSASISSRSPSTSTTGSRSAFGETVSSELATSARLEYNPPRVLPAPGPRRRQKRPPEGGMPPPRAPSAAPSSVTRPVSVPAQNPKSAAPPPTSISAPVRSSNTALERMKEPEAHIRDLGVGKVPAMAPGKPALASISIPVPAPPALVLPLPLVVPPVTLEKIAQASSDLKPKSPLAKGVTALEDASVANGATADNAIEISSDEGEELPPSLPLCRYKRTDIQPKIETPSSLHMAQRDPSKGEAPPLPPSSLHPAAPIAARPVEVPTLSVSNIGELRRKSQIHFDRSEQTQTLSLSNLAELRRKNQSLDIAARRAVTIPSFVTGSTSRVLPEGSDDIDPVFNLFDKDEDVEMQPVHQGAAQLDGLDSDDDGLDLIYPDPDPDPVHERAELPQTSEEPSSREPSILPFRKLSQRSSQPSAASTPEPVTETSVDKTNVPNVLLRNDLARINLSGGSTLDKMAALAKSLGIKGARFSNWESHCQAKRDRTPERKFAKDLPHILQDHMNAMSAEARLRDDSRKLYEAAMFANTVDDEPDAPPITLNNPVNGDPTPPWEFHYTNSMWYGDGVPAPNRKDLEGCACEGGCKPGDASCSCRKRQRVFVGDGGEFLYDKQGRLIYDEGYPIIECNDFCGCGDECMNRVVQHGRKVAIEIRNTLQKGWGVFAKGKKIPKGSFIGIYAGELLDEAHAQRRGEAYDVFGRTYLFNVDFWHLKLNRPRKASTGRIIKWKPKYVVDAYHAGNFTRFLNHSCLPNCQLLACYINEANLQLPLLTIFAIKDIPAGEELTFSYYGDIPNEKTSGKKKAGISYEAEAEEEEEETDEEEDGEGDKSLPKSSRTKVQAECHCGAPNCRLVLFE